MSNTNADKIAEELTDGLETYSSQIQDGICKIIDEKANELKNEIGSAAPHRTGKYRKSWRVKSTASSFSKYEKTVYASGDEYRLTHLLEKGHRKRSGNGKVAAQPHIAPAAEKILSEYQTEIKNLIKTQK